MMKDVTAPGYLAGEAELSNEFQSKGQEGVRNLVFVEPIELIAWLKGAVESEFIELIEGGGGCKQGSGRDKWRCEYGCRCSK